MGHPVACHARQLQILLHPPGARPVGIGEQVAGGRTFVQFARQVRAEKSCMWRVFGASAAIFSDLIKKPVLY
jgi:hypothetical protein